jgi:histidine triad (HIT) family protein
LLLLLVPLVSCSFPQYLVYCPLSLAPYLYAQTLAMTIFSKIIAGEIPSYKIAENDKFLAFLDVYPLVEGHVLVVPKVETDKLFDLEDSYLSEILVFARPIAKAIEKAFRCNRCGISVIGIEVPHAHVHLMPINNANDINFTRGKLNMSKKELKTVQEKILMAMEA